MRKTLAICALLALATSAGASEVTSHARIRFGYDHPAIPVPRIWHDEWDSLLVTTHIVTRTVEYSDRQMRVDTLNVWTDTTACSGGVCQIVHP